MPFDDMNHVPVKVGPEAFQLVHARDGTFFLMILIPIKPSQMLAEHVRRIDDPCRGLDDSSPDQVTKHGNRVGKHALQPFRHHVTSVVQARLSR